MKPPAAPGTAEELAEAVRAVPRLIPVGAGTKPRLTKAPPGFAPLSLSHLAGIVEYEPDEFTFTARAGTPVREIEQMLAAKGQHLPFDPPWADAGSTIGGAIASGLNGAGRFRYGGIRDFILGVRFVDGMGRLLRLGGKVVKNAAGFDVPKFLVGSAGRFGVIAEVTMKVFPRGSGTSTVSILVRDPAEMVRVVSEAARTPWEPECIEALPAQHAVRIRLNAPEAALPSVSRALADHFEGIAMPPADAEDFWRAHRRFAWADAGNALAKVPIVPDRMPALIEFFARVEGARIRFGNAGNVAWCSMPDAHAIAALDAYLVQNRMSGLLLRGDGPLWLGSRALPPIARAVKAALDPRGRFPDLDS